VDDAGGFDPKRHGRRRAHVPAASPDNVVPVGHPGCPYLDEDTVRLWARRVGQVQRPNGPSELRNPRASHEMKSAPLRRHAPHLPSGACAGVLANAYELTNSCTGLAPTRSRVVSSSGHCGRSMTRTLPSADPRTCERAF
jgi:hypothetical protein